MSAPQLVSVVIPTRDRLGYLRQAIDSVFAQTHGDWELIVVDDGSSDGTLEYLAALPPERVRVIANEPIGDPAQLENIGIEAARGHYIAFLDSDDAWLPQKLERQLAALGRNPSARWAFTDFICIDEKGLTVPTPARTLAGHTRSGWILERLIRHDIAIALPTVLVERSLLVEIGGFDGSLNPSADYDLWFRLAAKAPAVGEPERLAKIRIHDAKWSPTHPERFVSWIRVCERLIARTAEASIQIAARRSAAAAALRWSADRRARGDFAEAREKIALARGYGASVQQLAVATVKTSLKAITPRPIRDLYQRLRDGKHRPHS